jgi:hypothetical protein
MLSKMDIKKLKASFQLAQLRANSDPSETNLTILKQKKEDYENALDPEKKTENEPLDNQTKTLIQKIESILPPGFISMRPPFPTINPDVPAHRPTPGTTSSDIQPQDLETQSLEPKLQDLESQTLVLTSQDPESQSLEPTSQDIEIVSQPAQILPVQTVPVTNNPLKSKAVKPVAPKIEEA